MTKTQYAILTGCAVIYTALYALELALRYIPC